ncbi:polysaccharide biosynthesis tyrosine autokinase [Robertkochia marina]|uniref:non-specific protein-tyrosine kinase n=1 Tax=Robertkochia marina TaxID=1227945 RepID=A0A4S3M016_9FLAO|nr:tyrosine-protein kinase [Robertkochia marina]THD67714.1 polysaccharide biosynthesis tyrosine autokinase [Robertkochia marina]TRZ43445.1 polysaccharide biosynthesis tyrosine autokinase [Robertkochia marina]
MNEHMHFEQEEEIHLRELLERYLRHWKWFVLGVIVAAAGAVSYLKFATPVYQNKASILIKDEKGGGMASELSALQDLGMLGGMSSNSVENEIEILRSSRLMERVVEELELHLGYFIKEGFLTKEVYGTAPFKVKVLDYKKGVKLPSELVKITMLNDEQFEYAGEDFEGESFEGIADLGNKIGLPFAHIMVLPNSDVPVEDLLPADEAVYVSFSTIPAMAESLIKKIGVSLASKDATVINLSLAHPVRPKAKDVLNELVNQYNEDAIVDNNLVSKNTAEFIDARLQIIAKELDSVETDKVNFKSDNRLTDIQAEAQLFLENVSEVEKRHLELATQMEVINTMITYLEEGDNSKLLPANLGIGEGNEGSGLAGLITTYNTLVIERGNLRKNSTEKNPVVKNIDSQIEQLRATVLESLETQKIGLQIAMNDIRRRENRIEGEIAGVPNKEKQFRNIERQQNIKEALYLYLLQKREEASISMAVTAPKAKIVDYAKSSIEPVAPKAPVVLGGAVLLGLLFPFLVIFVHDILNNKIQSRKDIEKNLPELPIVGELPRLGEKEDKMIANDNRSALAESFRIIRTNLQYMFVGKDKNETRTIMVTSTTKGEGKSLTSSNLAISLANTGKKVVLVGADLRNPQIKAYFEHDRNRTGLSNFLHDTNISLDKIRFNSGISNLDLVTSGSIPPNPAELLMGERTAEFFKELKQKYDYVIIDSAPLLLVTDSLLITEYADLVVYVMRSGYSEERFTDFIKDTIKSKKLPATSIVLNDVKQAYFGYGNKYGYTYGQQEKTFFQKLLNR